eukprot:Selendium_serpulae@DN4924_c0_g1_i3.p1
MENPPEHSYSLTSWTPDMIGRGGGRRPSVQLADWEQSTEQCVAKAKDRLFLLAERYDSYIDRVVIPRGLIRDRIEKLAYDIFNYYKGEFFHIVCILKGATKFCSQIVTFLNTMHMYHSDKQVAIPYMEHYIRLRNHPDSHLEVIGEDLSSLAGDHVLIVDDIIDSGTTLKKFCAVLMKTLAPKSMNVAALLERQSVNMSADVDAPLRSAEAPHDATSVFFADFVGFSVPSDYPISNLVGFGLDYKEYFRDLEHICLVSQDGLKRFESWRRSRQRGDSPHRLSPQNGRSDRLLLEP